MIRNFFKKRKKLILWIAIPIGILLVLFLMLNIIAKYVIEKNDVKWFGREVTLSSIFINPFRGSVSINNLDIYEFKSDSICLHIDNISANMALTKLFSKTYEIENITIKKPKGSIIQNKAEFNFSDIIRRFSSDSTNVDTATTSEPTKLRILNMKIVDGEFRYIEQHMNIDYKVVHFNAFSPGYMYDEDTLQVNVDLQNGMGKGAIASTFKINLATQDYQADVKIDTFELQIIEQYIQDLANKASFRALLDLAMYIEGNTQDPESMFSSGFVKISDLHFGKNPQEDFIALEEFYLQMREVAPRNFKYIFDSVIVKQPYFKYERYDDQLDNIQTMFGRKGENIKQAEAEKNEGTRMNLILLIADFVKELSDNFLKSYIMADRIAIYNADIAYVDFALNDVFQIEANPLTITADRMEKDDKQLSFSIQSKVNNVGKINISATIDPNNTKNFTVKYNISEIPVPMFNSYLIYYSSFPADRGSIQLKGEWNVQNGQIDSKNNLLVIDPRFADRLKQKGISWLPMRLILSIVKSKGNVIDYNVPITGDLKSPNFNLWDVIGDILTNIFVKPPSLGHILKVKNVEQKLEKNFTVKWGMIESQFTKKQSNFLQKIAKFLKENPQTKIRFEPMIYVSKEKEYIIYYEAKKKFYMSTYNLKSITSADSIKIFRMSNRDTSFVQYIKEKNTNPEAYSVYHYAKSIVDSKVVDKHYADLLKQREANVRSYFQAEGVENQISVAAAKSTIPVNGFSYYLIEYKGDYPYEVIDAYYKMNDLNNKISRRDYKKERKKIGTPIPEVKESKKPKKADL